MDGMAPAVGHNSQETTLDAELIRDQLGIDFAPLIRRRDELLGGFDRWSEKTVNGIETDEAAQKTTDFVKQIKATMKEADGERDKAKRPYDDAAKVVQAFFKPNIIEKLEAAVKAMERALTVRARKVEEEARRVAAEDARRRREEADRLAEAARAAQSVELMEQAVEVSTQADTAERVAVSSSAELTRVRGDLGGVSSTTTRWTYEVTDFMALVRAVADGKVPPNYLTTNDSIIGASVRGKDGLRDIPGLSIFADKNVRVR